MLEGMIHAGKSRVTFVIPNAKQGALNTLYRMATVEDVDYGADAVRVTAVVDAKVRGMLREFDPDAPAKKQDWE
jgi:50S ribosomal subunit-associated GTPase HflX